MAPILSKNDLSEQFLDNGEINCLYEKFNNSSNDEERNYYALELANNGDENILKSLNKFCKGGIVLIFW